MASVPVVHLNLCSSPDRPTCCCDTLGAESLTRTYSEVTCRRCLRDPLFHQARTAVSLERIADALERWLESRLV